MKNRAMVDRISGGKVGYVHVARMVWNDFIKFEEEIYARGAGKDGLIIDVRNNGSRSDKGDIGTTRAMRVATFAVNMPGSSIRATRCPPAEWPVNTSGPSVCAAIAVTAAAIWLVIPAIDMSGHKL